MRSGGRSAEGNGKPIRAASVGAMLRMSISPSEAPARMPGPRAGRLLRLYWAAALGASAFVLDASAWPSPVPAAVAVAGVVALLAVLVPIALLAALRGGPFALACRILS